MIRPFLIIVFFLTTVFCFAQKLHIDAPVKMLALGDSYTYGESVAAQGRWPIQLTTELRLRGLRCDEATFVAVSGWRTDNLIKGIADAKLKNEYNLVSLLIGVNNYYQGGDQRVYREEFEKLLQTAIQLAQGNKQHVIVLSIPDYGYTPFGKSQQSEISQGIDAFNAINETVSKDYGVPYLSITDISRRGLREPELVATDGLHPSAKQYTLWVNYLLADALINTPAEEPIVTDVENEQLKLRIYPNPFEDKLFIENVSQKQRVKFLITDTMGRIVSEEVSTSTANSKEIVTSSLASGLYFIRVYQNTKIVHQARLLKR